jgi:type III secretion control protein HpaP
VHRAQAVRGAHAGGAAVQGVLKPAAAPLAQLVDFIVSSVADFYSSPAMLDSGNWSLTLSIDSAALPGCTLSLALSYFDLTLRFDTTNESSRQLILEHTDLLRARLEELFKTQPAAPRGIEIIVM